MHVDCCKIVIEDVSSGEGWAGNKVPKFVVLSRVDQLNIDLFSEILHHLPEDAVIHQFV